MSKILLTGMSAPQASRKSNERTLSFAGVLDKSLRAAGHAVVWETPSMDWNKEYLDQFDSVIVGVSPLTSLSANYCYGGLHVLSELIDDPKLTLMVDSPQPGQLEASFKTTIGSPETFTKDFYFNRRGFQQASDPVTRTRLLGTVERLLNGAWPTTIYPSLPWHELDTIKTQFTENAAQNLVGINLDAELLVEERHAGERRLKWSADTLDSPWAKKVISTLIYPVSPMKWHKGWEDKLVEEQIGRSTGVLISPHKKDGTWWTYRYVQALNTGTPIATLWTEAVHLDESWGNLAANIETLSQAERDTIAIRQRESYEAGILPLKDARKKLQKTLGITKRKESK
jgi:hypothetical protein